jgi:pyruvate kinase
VGQLVVRQRLRRKRGLSPGLPSRAEITDAAVGERAECVMLNKGQYLCDAVEALDDILQRMQDHQVKKSATLRRLKRW